jgi:two-component system response regulator DesR
MTARRSEDSVGHGETRSIRVLLAEEVDMFRAALVSLLSKEVDIEVVADVKCDPKVVVSLASGVRPDVTVVAVDEGVAAGLATVRALREAQAECPVIALTVGRPAGLVHRLTAAGVSGVIDKSGQASLLMQAIRVVARGVTVVDEDVVAASASVGPNPFTPRERDVLQVAAKGARGPEIARTLSLSPGTVRNYLSNVMTKTGARNRIDAIRIAKEAGWF